MNTNHNELYHKSEQPEQPAPCSDTDEAMQAAVSIVALLYGEGLITYRLDPNITGDFEFAVKIVYRLLKTRGATFADFPTMTYSTPNEQR